MMRRVQRWLACVVVTLVAVPGFAAVPGQVDFQGLLLDSAGQPATGTVDLVFTLFDAPTAGTAVWSETLPTVPLVDGVYSVTLGATTPIASSVLATGDVHLEISVDGEVLTPRRALLAVPYAVRATDAENLGGASNLFYTEMIQHFAFDGGDPPNDDPSEGTGDTDADGLANFVDSDNDDDGLSDTQELAQGSDINVITPDISNVDVTPFTSGQTDFEVTGTEFIAGMTATFDGVPVTLQNLTATSFDFSTPVIGSSGLRPLVLTRPNGQIATADVQVDPLVPTISVWDPDSGVRRRYELRPWHDGDVRRRPGHAGEHHEHHVRDDSDAAPDDGPARSRRDPSEFPVRRIPRAGAGLPACLHHADDDGRKPGWRRRRRRHVRGGGRQSRDHGHLSRLDRRRHDQPGRTLQPERGPVRALEWNPDR
jgi:hypothetical protein